MAQWLSLGLSVVFVSRVVRVLRVGDADRRGLSFPHRTTASVAAGHCYAFVNFRRCFFCRTTQELYLPALLLESQIAAVGRSAAPVEAAPTPAVVVSKEEEDLVARARALLSDAEPAPTPTRVEPVDDGLDVDMDLIRRARALRGASQLARTESK